VTPISFRYASAEKESTLACSDFQPKRPMATVPGDSSTGTCIGVPQTPRSGWLHCQRAMASSNASGTAST